MQDIRSFPFEVLFTVIFQFYDLDRNNGGFMLHYLLKVHGEYENLIILGDFNEKGLKST